MVNVLESKRNEVDPTQSRAVAEAVRNAAVEVKGIRQSMTSLDNTLGFRYNKKRVWVRLS